MTLWVALSFSHTLFTRDCDKIINMPVLKDHSNSGITFCLKNISYGISDNNSRADFYAQPPVRKKVVLNIGDGLEGCYDRGPDPPPE